MTTILHELPNGVLRRSAAERIATRPSATEAGCPLTLDDAQVVHVQPHGRGTPIFALYNVGIFYTLANRLGRDRPFIAVQTLDPHSSRALPEQSFEAIAADFVRVIRSVRPRGPYVLLGLCIAGTVAYEVARQLRAEGEDVPLLILVDGWAPGYTRRLTRSGRILARFSFRWHDWRLQLSKVAHGKRGFLEFCSRFQIVRRLGLLRIAERLRLITAVPEDPSTLWFEEYLGRAARAYEPARYEGCTVVFHSPEQPSGRFLDPNFGWRDLCVGKFDCVEIPGDHLGLFQDPGVSLLAQWIASELARQGV
jgi:thioesterase domain-containing protein